MGDQKKGKRRRRTALNRWKAFNSHWKPSHLLLYFFLGFWAIQADPFGLSSASDKALSEELSRIRAFLNPVAPAPITVVSIDYDSIRALHANGSGWMAANDWPLAYDEHARIIGTLLDPGKDRKPGTVSPPAAVFYDIFFERPRIISGDMDKFGRTLKRMQARLNVPVYLAGGGSYMPISDDSYLALQAPSLAVTAKEGYGDFYPLYASLRDASQGAQLSPQHGPFAATALYMALCQQRGEDCSWARDKDALPLALQWEVLDRSECSMWGAASRFSRIVSGVWSILARVVGASDHVDTAPASCLPFHQVRLADVFADPSRLKPPHLAVGEPYAVLVGVVMKSMNDYHATPVYGQASGVVVHAMALENFNRLGAGYIRDYDVRAAMIATWGVLLLMFWIGIKAPARWLLGSRMRSYRLRRWLSAKCLNHLPRKWYRLLRWLTLQVFWWGLFVLAVVGLYVIFYIQFDIAPEGWLSLIALVPLLRQVVIQGEKKFDEKEG